ncbi:MAG: TIGR04283 family arsenosugar biosynthesis glycosyltransferase [Gammaproteobacteria bacterium]
MPVFNEAAIIRSALRALQPLRQAGHELIVADGGSSDDGPALAAGLADRVIHSERGRARQMNAGAGATEGDILLFLHADTMLPQGADRAIITGLKRSARCWGRFDVRLAGRQRPLRLVETLMNLRSRLSGIATGDQAVFVRRSAFQEVGGFPPIELMEDIALSKRLKRLSRPLCLRQRVITSSRRWEQHGILPTILFMWRLRLAYFLGADPARLAQRYYRP